MILNFLELHIYWAYLVLFLLMFIEGEGALLLYGFLSRMGYFYFPVLFLSASVFVFFGDIIWYWMGAKFWPRAKRRLGSRVTSHFSYRFLKGNLVEHKKKTVFASKFAYGLNHAVIFAAGAAKIDFNDFLKINAFAAAFFTFVFLSLGFGLGEGYHAVGRSLRHFSLIAIGVVAVMFVISHFLKKVLKLRN